MSKRGRPVTHGQSRLSDRSPTYTTWAWMKQSCNNPRHRRYKTVGARGINYAAKWDDYAEFVRDMGEKPAGAFLRRHDETKHFTKANCYWHEPERVDQRANTG